MVTPPWTPGETAGCRRSWTGPTRPVPKATTAEMLFIISSADLRRLDGLHRLQGRGRGIQNQLTGTEMARPPGSSTNWVYAWAVQPHDADRELQPAIPACLGQSSSFPVLPQYRGSIHLENAAEASAHRRAAGDPEQEPCAAIWRCHDEAMPDGRPGLPTRGGSGRGGGT